MITFRRVLSYLVGLLSMIPLGGFFGNLIKHIFVSVVGIDMKEAEFDIGDYGSIQAIFTRALKPNQREIAEGFCSPCDGTLCIAAQADNNEAVQVKGFTYSLGELVGGVRSGDTLSWYATIYLAPHNYHRVHSPFAGKLTEIEHIAGDLWPVNPFFVKRVKNLFNRNERVIFKFDLGEGAFGYVVMVGALNVGSIVTPWFQGLMTNQKPVRGVDGSRTLPMADHPDLGIAAELGTFRLGSTVVLVLNRAAADRYSLLQSQSDQPILLGQSLLAPENHSTEKGR